MIFDYDTMGFMLLVSLQTFVDWVSAATSISS